MIPLLKGGPLRSQDWLLPSPLLEEGVPVVNSLRGGGMSRLGVTPLIDRLLLSIVIEDQSQMRRVSEGKEMRTLVYQETSQTSQPQSR